MKTKILSLLLLVPIFFVIIAFTTSNTLVLSYVPQVENLILEHDSKEAVSLNEPYKLYAYTVPSIVESEIIWWVEDSEKAYIEDGYLYALEEGKIEVYASLKDGTLVRSFTAYACSDSSEAKFIIINNPLDTKNGISSDYCFGEFDYENEKKVSSKMKLDITVLPLSVNQDLVYSVKDNKATYDGEYLTFNDTGLIEIEVSSKSNPNVKDSYTFNLIEDGVNIYSYDDLMLATNRSSEGDIVVMQTSLESYSNAYKVGDAFYPNTKLFGYGEKGHLEFDYVEFESTYDTTFLKKNDMSTTLKMAVEIKKDVYGNGFTINLHEMAYPGTKQSGTGKPELTNSDLFRGPLAFVDVAGVVVSGQDNIGFGIVKDNVTIKNINLKNCNMVSDLTHLDYTGTVVEVMGNNVTIEDSVISNGRTVVRSFSSENLVIDNCLLQYAREFILKLGSNSVLKPKSNQTIPSSKEEKYLFLSPIPLDDEGNVLSDSSCEIVDTYFNTCGFFAIGIDTHFAGDALYNGYGFFTSVSDLAGTSYATHLSLDGDIKIYNWRKVSELDTSTLIYATPGALINPNDHFNIALMIENKLAGTNELIKEDGETIVHGGIALFGGGRNLSTVTFKNENLSKLLSSNGDAKVVAALDDPAFGSGEIVFAAGYGEFKFYLYSAGVDGNLYNEVVNLDDLKR